MAADLERPVSITATTTDETPPVSRFKVSGDSFDRYRLTPTGVYTGDGTAAPKQSQPVGRYSRPSLNTSLAETFTRLGHSVINTSPLTTQILYLQAIELPANLLITGAGFISGTQAAGTPTNWWYVLASSARAVLAVTADQTSAAFAANTDKPLAFGATYTTTAPGLFYVGIMMKATTPIDLMGLTSSATMTTPVPIIAGASNTGATTAPALAATLTAITPAATQLYAYLY